MTSEIPLAHGTIEGIGDLWNGILHPLREPAHIMVLCGLALIAGQRSRIKTQIVFFLAASAAGIAFTLVGPRFALSQPPQYLPSAVAGLTGAIVSTRLPLSLTAKTSLFAAAAFILGWDSGQDATDPLTLFKLLAGSWIGLAVVILNLANYASLCPKKQWAKIGFRVLGSWVAAASILFLAFTLRAG